MEAAFRVEALEEALGPPRQAGDLRHRSGQPVHRRGLHRRADQERDRHQHGRQRCLARQRLRRAALAIGQVRGGLPQPVNFSLIRQIRLIPDSPDGLSALRPPRRICPQNLFELTYCAGARSGIGLSSASKPERMPTTARRAAETSSRPARSRWAIAEVGGWGGRRRILGDGSGHQEGYAMEEGTVVPLPKPGATVADDPLLAVLREGARRMLMQVVEAEVEAFIAAHADLTDGQGRRRVVRNGHAPERHIQTGIGPLAVSRPRVRDRGGDGSGPVRFSSAVLPPYLRRARNVEELLPWLYLKGVSTGQFAEALVAL